MLYVDCDVTFDVIRLRRLPHPAYSPDTCQPEFDRFPLLKTPPWEMRSDDLDSFEEEVLDRSTLFA